MNRVPQYISSHLTETELNLEVFSIIISDEKEWIKDQSEMSPGSSQLKEITRQSGKVFVYVTPLDMVLEGKEHEEDEQMSRSIPDIIKTFKLQRKN